MTWRPLSIRRQPDSIEEHDALVEGVPEWLRHGLEEWIVDAVTEPNGLSSGARLHLIEQSLRMPLNWVSRNSAMRSIVDKVYTTSMADQVLDVVDFLLSISTGHDFDYRRRKHLILMLRVAGSAWTVGEVDERYGLARRVDDVVQERFDEESAASGNVAVHLKKAWADLYGRSPDPSSSYRESTRAIEAALKPIVLPNDPKATLGLMISAMNDKPSKWTLAFHLPAGDTAIETTRQMLELCWRAQIDRHGRTTSIRP